MIGSFLKRKSFKHGIHPPEHKEDTCNLPIRQFPFAPLYMLPLKQHIGAPSQAIVKEGQYVRRGELIAKADGFVSVALHAPVDGRIKRIADMPTASGLMTKGIYLESTPASSQEAITSDGISPDSDPNKILEAIQKAGIVGLGGAAFPTHVKLKVPEGKKCHKLILNGIECEPYLTTDHRVMLEQSQDILIGINYLLKVSAADECIIAIEANKMDAALHLSNACKDIPEIRIEVLPVKYPQGSEKMLITALLDKEVPSGKFPIDIGCIVVNIATCAEIGRLLPMGRGIQERVVTITGPGVEKKGNYLIPIGTPLRHVLDFVKVKGKISEVYLGGPMMGKAISNLDISITKGTSGILVYTENEVPDVRKEYPCIKCAACVDACPLFLNPAKLGLLAKFKKYKTMEEAYNLMECFECGSCSYVCPSNIPLVQYFKSSKAIIRKQNANKQMNE